jgi:branched-chain amino acid transport system substrate-binding protein
VLSVLIFACSTKPSDGKIHVGVMVPLSGETASYGMGVKHGIELAFLDLKQSGKISNLVLNYEDSRCEGRSAVNAINKLISINHVSAIIGEVCSGGTLAAAPIAEKNHVPMVSPASTSPAISEAGDYIFRVIPSDALQGEFGAKLIEKQGKKTLAILYPNEDYGLGFSKVLSERFTAIGGKVVASEAFERGSIDLRSQLTKIKSKNPEALFLISNSPDSALAALRQIKELGIKAALYGSEGLKCADVEHHPAAEGLQLSSVSSGSPEFLKHYLAIYKEEPGPFAAQGYDSMMAIGLAVVEAGADSKKIQGSLISLNFDGASGKISFDANGDVAGNYDLFVVKSGKFTLVKP